MASTTDTYASHGEIKKQIVVSSLSVWLVFYFILHLFHIWSHYFVSTWVYVFVVVWTS
jgi:hypothetical protein